ncbi:hypothetical protein MSG28_000964 [Choristoneura fumiferana]|uniref:Uncharacterized protein n=1 Tax=Choristoneura fumiferana TaxID=7141 RepID=A0ACC0K374_CHOFU|nr:hypothetical protein MSG28_000964 [Choristoneura fumiferana]
MPLYQELTEEQKQIIRASSTEEQNNLINHFIEDTLDKCQKKESLPDIVFEKVNNGCLQLYVSLPKESSTTSKLGSFSSSPSTWTLRSKRRSVSFSDTVNYLTNDDTCSIYSTKMDVVEPIFGKKETTVYMTLFDESCRHRTSGTQATASINKCFQAAPTQSVLQYNPSAYCGTISDCSSIYSTSTAPCRSNMQRPLSGSMRYSDVICYLEENEKSKEHGMGSQSGLNRTVIVAPLKQEKKCRRSGKTDKKTSSSSIPSDQKEKKTKGCSAGTSPSKAVSIKDPEKPCPAAPGTKGDIIATISHVKIGPREFCPVHGREPCQGPKCIVAANSGEEKAPVKISNVNNPRRGVFELVIRRISGAPLARNELMLEWTPPPARPPPCGPCPVVCSPPGPCRPVKCRMIVCRSSCEPKCCKKRCKKPCGPKPCRVVPCLPPPPYKPCKPCKPCDPPFPFKSAPCSPCPPCASCPPCPPFPSCSPGPPCLPLCSKPKRPCRPPRPCRPCPPFKLCPPSKPCKSCRPCKPCKPDLASPTPRTSIIFKPNAPGRNKPRCCKPRCSQCRPCSPSGPFKPRCPSPPCLSCCKPCKPRKPCGPAPCRRPACKRCKPRKSCKPCPPPRCRPCLPCPSPPSCDPCPPFPCSTPCYLPSCSNPCFRPCPSAQNESSQEKDFSLLESQEQLSSGSMQKRARAMYLLLRPAALPAPRLQAASMLQERLLVLLWLEKTNITMIVHGLDRSAKYGQGGNFTNTSVPQHERAGRSGPIFVYFTYALYIGLQSLLLARAEAPTSDW